jgi:membrane dipeptidase
VRLNTIPVFDGHNDVLLRLWSKKKTDTHLDFINGDGLGHIDLPRMKAGGMSGGLFAIFAPPVHSTLPDDDNSNPPLEGQLAHRSAVTSTDEMATLLETIVRNSGGAVSLCRSAADIREAMSAGSIATVMHIEGAEAIGAELEGLQGYYDRGLRSLGPVWSRPNVFGHGVPFRFPSTPDTGEGLTSAGKHLIAACNRLGILVDLSHLNEKGFWDIAKIADAPLVASHSNAHAIAASSRNLTDAQIQAVGESGGIVGLNFATGFLREDGRWDRNTSSDIMMRHLDYFLHLAGEDCVGFGSDFDGARIPNFIGDSAGLPAVIVALQAHGYGESLIKKITVDNWLRVLERTWGG